MIIAVIPARGGSKGIPRKNVRMMNGRPLIAYVIENAVKSKYIDTVVVSSDDAEILNIAAVYKAITLQRDTELAKDAVTLDPVIYDAVVRMEQEQKVKYDIIVTLQPTSPLLSAETLDTALEFFVSSGADTCISVVNKPHLSWREEQGRPVKNYEKRLNRQQLPPNYVETGAFVFTKRDALLPDTRIGDRVTVYEMPEEEAVDIDSYADWIFCEHYLKKKRIMFRADGYRELGMGHIYHCLTLAYHMPGHDIVFVTNKNHKEGLDKLLESNMKVEAIGSDEELFALIGEWKPDVFVNDCLNTNEDYIRELKKRVGRVVTIEDVGSGAEYADVVINALYEDEMNRKNHFWGEKYVCLRDEFLTASPVEFSEHVKNIVVIFGGTDPSDFTSRMYDIATRMGKIYPQIHFSFVIGRGYQLDHTKIKNAGNIDVARDVVRVSDYFKDADLAVTSQGRTVYELAAMGVPAVVIAQNERETRHTFAQMTNGFMNLGLGSNVSDITIEHTLDWLIQTPQIRKEMRELMLKHDLKKGIQRVVDLILEEDDK